MPSHADAARERAHRSFDNVRWKSFAECRNSHTGAVFIIASGPSARDFPLTRYADFPMFAMNGSIHLFAEAGLTPLFYLCDDSSFVRNRLPLLLEGMRRSHEVAFSERVVAELARLSSDSPGTRSIHRLERAGRMNRAGRELSDREFARRARHDPDFECRFSWFRQKPNRIGFSRNLDKGYFNSRTIPYAGIQLAYHLGFSRVFLVGVDLDSKKGRSYEKDEQAVPSRLDGDYEDYILPSFQLLAERVINPDFQVFNLSLDSRLPSSVVPKISLDQLDAMLNSPHSSA